MIPGQLFDRIRQSRPPALNQLSVISSHAAGSRALSRRTSRDEQKADGPTLYEKTTSPTRCESESGALTHGSARAACSAIVRLLSCWHSAGE